MMRESLWLFSGVLAVLVIASATASIMIGRAGRPVPSSLLNLDQRIKAWWVMVAVMAVAFIFGRGGMTMLFALISFMALREFVTLTHSKRGDHHVLVGMFLIVLPVQYWLVWTSWYGLFSIFVPVYCFLLMPAVTALNGDTERFLERISAQQWALMLAVYCISHVPALVFLDVPGFADREILLVAFLLIVVQGSDVLQYIFGKLFGRHLLASKVSPSKTWEGLTGGVLSASLLGAMLSFLTPFTPFQAGGVAFVICLMGFLGGLVASAIKRDQGVKDWGTMIEGHGGMLDRADSLIFAAPVFFHIVRYWWTV